MSAVTIILSIPKLRLRRNGPGKVRKQPFEVKRLKEPRTKNTFTLQMKNKFQALADAEKHTPRDTSDINNMWEQHADQSSLHIDQRSLLETQADEEELVDHRSYLESHR